MSRDSRQDTGEALARRGDHHGLSSLIAGMLSVTLLLAACTGRPIQSSIHRWEITGLQRIGEGAFPTWSPGGDLIAFCKPVDGTYEVFTMQADGDASKATCLTCDKPGLKGTGHRGQPHWHPGGEYIAFTAENAGYRRRGIGRTELPGIGRNHDVWIMTSDGGSCWNMTGGSENWGNIRPWFSHDGRTLYWNEEWSMEKYPGVGAFWDKRNLAQRRGEEVGLWRIRTAHISFGPSGPQLSSVRIVPLPSHLTLIEGEGLSPDDKRLIFSACSPSETQGRCLWGDIYAMDLEKGMLRRLTKTPYRHDENGAYSPHGSVIAWNQSKGLPGVGPDLYLMDTNGRSRARLTHFTEPGYPEYDENARQITELSWSPDGTRIVFGHASRHQQYGTVDLGSSLYILTVKI
jgi:Tol biopolymer transport system component